LPTSGTTVGAVNWGKAWNRQQVGELNMSKNGAAGEDQIEFPIVDDTPPLACWFERDLVFVGCALMLVRRRSK
jgi:hypothetical protein